MLFENKGAECGLRTFTGALRQSWSFETLLNVILVKQGVNAEWLFAVGLCFDKSA